MSDRPTIISLAPKDIARAIFEAADDERKIAAQQPDPMRNAAASRHRYAAECLEGVARAIDDLADWASGEGGPTIKVREP